MAMKMGLGLAYDLANAEHTYEGALAHWIEMVKRGATEAEKKAFLATIGRAREALDGAPDESGPTLKDVRVEIDDLVGDYRTAAGIIANGIGGRSARLERELRVGNGFPRSDVKMRAYLDGLDKVMKKHALQLAQRGFSKEQQTRLVDTARLFAKLLHARGAVRGEAGKARTSRDALFEILRKQTSYFRRLGRAAFRDSAARADFDRVHREQKQRKAAPPPAPPASTKAAAA